MAAFDGGAITSDAGGLLLGATDRALDLMRRLTACFSDFENPHNLNGIMRTFGATARYDDEPLDAHYSGRDQSSHITRGCCRHCRDCISTCSAVMQSSPCWVSMPCASYRWIMALPRNSENPLSSMGFGHATCLRIAALPSQTGVLAVFPLYYQRIDRGWPAVQSQPHRFTCIAQKMPSQARANRGGVTPRDATGNFDSSERFEKR